MLRKAAGQEIDWNEIKQEFRARIGTEFPFVKEVTKCAAEAAISDLRQAINTYNKTKQVNPKSRVKFPGRRKRNKKIGGFGLNNDKFSASGYTVYVSKLGEVTCADISMTIFSCQIVNGSVRTVALNMNGTKMGRLISKWKACAFSPVVATSA